MSEPHGKFGTMRGDLSAAKDQIDFFLTRFPSLYLAIEEHREWTNWDKRVYLSFVRRGDVVFDVGANVGAHTVFFSHLVGERGEVLAYEPLSRNIEATRQLLDRRLRYRNVTLVETAVGNPDDGVTETELLVPGGDFTQASLKRQYAGSWSGEPVVRSARCALTSLDRESAARGLERVDFLKLDVEGGELDVLKGARRMLARHRPVIYCEAFEKWTTTFGYSPGDLLALALSLGYAAARVIAGGRVFAHDLDSAPDASWFARSADILFIPPGRSLSMSRFDKRYVRGALEL